MSALSLADAKLHLNITGSPTTLSDVELQSLIDSAESIIAERTGPLAPTTVVSRVRADGSAMLLPVTPVIAVTSIAAVGSSTAVSVSQMHVDPAGVITWTDGRIGFTSGLYDVTYQAGRGSIPESLLWGVKEQVRHLVRTQRGGTARPGSPAAADTAAPGFLIPHAVAEAIEAHVQELGFA